MKKLTALVLICCLLVGLVCVPTAAETTATEITESFEVNKATTADEGFVSSNCVVSVKEGIYKPSQNDFRKVNGAYSLLTEMEKMGSIDFERLFSVLGSLSGAELVDVSFYLYGEQLNNGEKGQTVPVKVELVEKAEDSEAVLHTYMAEITCDKDFNSDLEGFEKIEFSVPAEKVKNPENTVFRITAGSEDSYPTILFADDITVKAIAEEKDAAVEAEYSEPGIIGLLRAIGISNTLTEDYVPSREMTRADFADIISGFLNMKSKSAEIRFDDVYQAHYAYDSIKLVSEFGIMSGTGNRMFEPDKPITYMEAVSALVKFLGYEEPAQISGGYPVGFHTMGKQLNLISAGRDTDAVLTCEALADMLERFVKAEVLLTASIWVDNPHYAINYKTDGETTILKQFFDIDSGRGVMELTDAASTDDVVIGGVRLGTKYSKVNTSDLSGYNVDYYYKENNLIYAAKNNRNKELVIAQKDFDGVESSNLWYYLGESRKKADVFNCTVVFNGVETEFKDDLFANFIDGELIILDNNNDGDGEILFVNSYEYYVVKGVDKTNESIMDKYSRPSLRLKDFEKVVLKKADMTDGTLADISENDVLRVKRFSETDTGYIELVVYKNRVIGTVSGIKADGGQRVVTVDGKEYVISQTAEEFLSERYIPDLSVGSRVTLLLNDAEVMSWLRETSDSLMAGYIVQGGTEDNGITKTRIFKILTEYGTLELFDVNDKLKLDGVSGVGAMSQAFENKFFADGKVVQQLVRYKLNGKGKISEIETAETYVSGTTVLKKDKLVKISDGLEGSAYINYKNSGIAYWTYGTDGQGGVDIASNNKLYAISPNAVAFTVPEKGGRYEDDLTRYTVSKGWNITGVGGTEPKAYVVNGVYNIIDYFVTQVDNPGGDYIWNFKAQVAIVTNVEREIDEEGNYYLKIECFLNNTKSEFRGDFFYQPEDESDPLWFDYNRISPGDLIIYSVDSNGVADLYNREKNFYFLMDYDEETNSLSTVYSDLSGTNNGYEGRIAGQRGGWFNALMYVYDIKDGYVFLNYGEDKGAPETNRVFDYTKFKTYIYNGERGLLYEGDMTEATAYVNDPKNPSPVYVMLREGMPVSMIIYK